MTKRFVCGLLMAICFSSPSFAQNPDSLDFKIGQMILIGIPRASTDTLVMDEVRNGRVGTIILFEKNIPKKPNAFADLKKIIWAYKKVAPIPLFVAIDQEGGKVNRLKEKYGFTRSITAAATGKSKSLDSARFYADATAATLAGLGFNINFGPVVDVAAEPTNPVIVKSERSYSANEDSVALFAKEFVKQHRKYGVITVLKHFPGHGSSTSDTHYGVADVTNTWSERELKPYKILIDSGYVDAVMTAHIVNKNLDKSGNPGTLSQDVLQGILRNRLGYSGVVFSDDMQMEAISKQYGFEQAIIMAIQAGVDIMCFANNVPGSQKRKVELIFATIKDAVAKGTITSNRIDESYRRIMKLKRELTVDLRTEYKRLLEKDLQNQQKIKMLTDQLTSLDKKNKKKKKKTQTTNETICLRT
ncbi:MAG: glycoside hydrolase family 3 protein [Cytophagales bacterium]